MSLDHATDFAAYFDWQKTRLDDAARVEAHEKALRQAKEAIDGAAERARWDAAWEATVTHPLRNFAYAVETRDLILCPVYAPQICQIGNLVSYIEGVRRAAWYLRRKPAGGARLIEEHPDYHRYDRATTCPYPSNATFDDKTPRTSVFAITVDERGVMTAQAVVGDAPGYVPKKLTYYSKNRDWKDLIVFVGSTRSNDLYQSYTIFNNQKVCLELVNKTLKACIDEWLSFDH